MTRIHTAVLGLILALASPLAAAAAAPEDELPARATVDTDSGGFLMPEQRAYDVRFYDLDLAIQPEERRIAGTLTVRAEVLEPLAFFVLDLDRPLQVSRVTRDGQELTFEHRGQRLWIDLGETVTAGWTLVLAVDYSGQPREAPNPPWEGGFTWSETADGSPWIGVSCQIDGADLWWPVKDHPSDEPEEGVALHFRVPQPLVVASNGRLEAVEKNDDGTHTWHWRVTGPINTYNVTVNVAPFEVLTTDYTSVAGETLPISYFVLPEDVEQGKALFPELVDHLRFLEERFGPYPFRADKYAVVEAPYLAMEHQTVITYGQAFGVTRFGFHWIAFHELAHEWWGNLASASDWNAFWLHEGFDGYSEALYVEEKHGQAGYHEYLQRFFRPALVNQRPVSPRRPRSIRQVYYAIPPGYTRVDADAYAKGALVLHTLRYLVGDETFFEILRRQAYPDPGLEAVSDGSAPHSVSTGTFVRRAEEISGRNLEWFFDVYVHQPELPELVTEVRQDRLRLAWNVPDGLHFPMPVELEVDGERRRIELPGGETEIPWAGGHEVVADPDFWILRQAVPDPDRFGSLGADEVPFARPSEAGGP